MKLLVFSVTPFKIGQNRKQNPLIDKVQNLGNERPITDKVTWLSSINSYEDVGIKMTDIESLVKAVRLAWLKRIFSDNESTWKFYLLHLLRNVGGLLLFK